MTKARRAITVSFIVALLLFSASVSNSRISFSQAEESASAQFTVLEENVSFPLTAQIVISVKGNAIVDSTPLALTVLLELPGLFLDNESIVFPSVFINNVYSFAPINS